MLNGFYILYEVLNNLLTFYISLVPLLSRIREDKVEYLFNELLKTLATNKDAQNRDIAASGLKSMINEFPSVHSEHVGKIFGRFSQALLQELKVSPIVFKQFVTYKIYRSN